jgi:hypothetical protein
MRRQLAVTIAADVAPTSVRPLRALLESMGEDAAGNDVIPFGHFSTTHFARLLLLEQVEDPDGRTIPAKLVYLSDIDEPLEQHLDELLEHGPGLDRVFEHCEGYPSGRVAPSRAQRSAWLREHMTGSGAYYVNTIGRTLQQVRDEDRLRRAIATFVDESDTDWSQLEPHQVRAAIQDFVNTRSDLEWAQRPPAGPGLTDLVRAVPGLVALPLGALALTPLIAPALPFWLAGLVAQELTDDARHVRPDDAHVQALAALEDRGPQNQFSAVGFIKPGPVRRITVGAILPLLDYGIRTFFARGQLTGVRTIHFARWAYLDGRRRLIFASNYDGSLESYMDDFIDKVAWGLNAVFSNGVGYPRTIGLLFGGATREQEFKDYLRRRQVPTQVWYSAYPHLTAVNVANNSRVRAGLHGDMSAAETERWLARI